MKKLMVLFSVIVLVGCATAKSNYKAPDGLKTHFRTIADQVTPCISTTADITLMIHQSNEPAAALVDNEKIIFSEGMFRYDDDSLKFVMAHEIAHSKLGHSAKRKAASYATTGAFMVAGFFIPGVGLLNHAVNPAIVNNYSKSQELDADTEAAKACVQCMNISKDSIIKTLMKLSVDTKDGGDFWAQHPSWDDRIANIRKNL